MLFWLLALILLASLAGLGFRQGAIRVGVSFIGILVGALLAPTLGRLLHPLLTAVGLKNPLLVWVLGPFIVFVVVSVLFKVGALALHQKVEVFYKYKAGDLRLALWERLNHRTGLCVGLLNGTAYLVLISFIIYNFSYWTTQMVTPDADPWSVSLLNHLGRDMQSSGFARVPRSVSKLPDAYYDAADVAGIIYNNPLAEARLARYPGLLSIGEQPEFRDLANDKDFAEMRQRHEQLRALLQYPKVQAIVNNAELCKRIWQTLKPDVKDLSAYLVTLKSAKYDSERILGRWNFDARSAVAAYRRTHPSVASTEMQRMRKFIEGLFSKASLVAMPDHQALLKNISQLKVTAGAVPAGGQATQGQWQKLDAKYQFTFFLAGKEEQIPATIDGDRMTITNEGTELVLLRED